MNINDIKAWYYFIGYIHSAIQKLLSKELFDFLTIYGKWNLFEYMSLIYKHRRIWKRSSTLNIMAILRGLYGHPYQLFHTGTPETYQIPKEQKISTKSKSFMAEVFSMKKHHESFGLNWPIHSYISTTNMWLCIWCINNVLIDSCDSCNQTCFVYLT